MLCCHLPSGNAILAALVFPQRHAGEPVGLCRSNAGRCTVLAGKQAPKPLLPSNGWGRAGRVRQPTRALSVFPHSRGGMTHRDPLRKPRWPVTAPPVVSLPPACPVLLKAKCEEEPRSFSFLIVRCNHQGESWAGSGRSHSSR